MSFRNLFFGFVATSSMLGLFGCGDDSGDGDGAGGSATGGSDTGGSDTGGSGTGASGGSGGSGGSGADMATVTVQLSGLEPLGAGYVYEGWIIVDDAPVTTGRFQIEEGVDMYESMVAQADADAAVAFVLTIEPEDGDDPAPSMVHVLGGDVADGEATLSLDHGAALGTDFGGAVGTYILETPSSGGVVDDYDQGIWWLQMGGNGPAASLALPGLPEGWVYEGWVAGPNGPVSTGTFSAPAGADDDGAGPDAGPDAGPPFPGQDFVDPAMVITGMTAVISVEPMPDDSPTPFAIKPLVDMTIEDVGGGVSQDMANNSAGNPSGSVTIN